MKRALAAVALLGLATPALAGDKKDREEVEIKYKKVTEIDFREVDVNANVVRPPFKYVNRVTGLEFESLIEPRREFDREMGQSVDAIK